MGSDFSLTEEDRYESKMRISSQGSRFGARTTEQCQNLWRLLGKWRPYCMSDSESVIKKNS